MTDDFKELVTELAKGYNFPENAVVFGTAVNNEETQMYDITVHFGTQGFYPTECIIHAIVREFLRPLDDETAAMARDALIEIIANDEQRRAKDEQRNIIPR